MMSVGVQPTDHRAIIPGKNIRRFCAWGVCSRAYLHYLTGVKIGPHTMTFSIQLLGN